MKLRAVLLMLAVSTCLVSCGGDAQPSGETESAGMQASQAPVTSQKAFASKQPTKSKVTSADSETPPTDAQFMIFENVDPPSRVEEYATVETFTNDPNIGRQGLL